MLKYLLAVPPGGTAATVIIEELQTNGDRLSPIGGLIIIKIKHLTRFNVFRVVMCNAPIAQVEMY